VSYSTIQRHLRLVNTDDYRNTLAQEYFEHSRNRGTLSLMLYDVTTLYFEAENEDDFRKVGYSKERRIDPQIVVGLLVDRTGFPLEVSCFEGSTAEITTLVEVIDSYRQRHDLSGVSMVIAADAGKQLRPLRSATIVINGTSQTFPPDIPDAQAEILAHLGLTNGVLRMT
jgi:hypothetical protein